MVIDPKLSPSEVADMTGATTARAQAAWLYDREWEVGPKIEPRAWLDKHWREHVHGPEMKVYPLIPLRDIPEEADWIYFLLSRDMDVVYIGRTNSPRKRFLAHAQRGVRFSSYGFIEVRGELCHEVELAYIHAICPPANEMYEASRWAGHAAMVAAIEEAWAC